RTLETHHARRGPRNRVALHVGDGDHRIVEGGVHVCDAGDDVLALFTTDACDFTFRHSKPLGVSALPYYQQLHHGFSGSVLPDNSKEPPKSPARQIQTTTSCQWQETEITSSCRRSALPDPCGYEHWCGCADRGPAGHDGGAGHGSYQDPSGA